MHVSRDCKALKARVPPDTTINCLQVDCDPLTRQCEKLKVVTRAYLEGRTTTGPSYDELVWPRVIELKRAAL